jgi:hypothetical protein
MLTSGALLRLIFWEVNILGVRRSCNLPGAAVSCAGFHQTPTLGFRVEPRSSLEFRRQPQTASGFHQTLYSLLAFLNYCMHDTPLACDAQF